MQSLPTVCPWLQRLKAAFQYLERARAAKQIMAYGIASWTCFRCLLPLECALLPSLLLCHPTPVLPEKPTFPLT
jgi:hypothetical protein